MFFHNPPINACSEKLTMQHAHQPTNPAAPPNAILGHGLVNLKRAAPALYWGGISLLLLSCITAFLALIDPRLFQGVSVWLKPWKFQVSTGVYLLTLALFMVWLPKPALQSRSAKYVIWVALLSGLFEVIYIALQGAQGKASHFNTATPLDAWMYTLMGVGAGLLVSASLVLAIIIARSKDYALPAALKWSIVLGLLATFALGAGFGGYLSGQSTGHWVGAIRTDAGGLPLVTWSRQGGDLRVAHFFGIHAMHFIPFFAWVLHRLQTPQRIALPAVWGFTLLFSAWCSWTFIQALRGLPFWA
jgi:hypothetical protein